MPLNSNPFANSTELSKFFITPELSQRYNLIKYLLQNSEQLLLVLAPQGAGKTCLLRNLELRNPGQLENNWLICRIDGEQSLSAEVLLTQLLAQFKINSKGKSIITSLENLRHHIIAARHKAKLPILLVDDAHLLPLASLKLLIELAMQGDNHNRMRVVLFCEPQITSILATSEFAIVHDSLIHTIDIPNLKSTQIRDYIYFHLRNYNNYKNCFVADNIIEQIYAQTNGLPQEINTVAYQILQKSAKTNIVHRSRLGLELAILVIFSLVLIWLYWTMPQLFHTPTAVTSIIEPEPVQYPVAPAIIQPITTTTDEQWLLAQDPKTYTIQIMAAHDPENLHNFVQQSALNEVKMFKTSYQGRAWYVLVYGIYPSRSAAEQELQNLQADSKPWVRSLSGIQTLINYTD
jgi:DamX protein